jgi:hypothetical protein
VTIVLIAMVMPTRVLAATRRHNKGKRLSSRQWCKRWCLKLLSRLLEVLVTLMLTISIIGRLLSYKIAKKHVDYLLPVHLNLYYQCLTLGWNLA